MATTTSGNLALTKPTYSESADIGVINSNMDKIDSAVSGLDGALAIVATGTTAPQAISSGQFVLWQNALYKATAAIASGATLSSSNLTAVSGGGLNALNNNIAKLQQSQFWTNSAITLADVQNYADNFTSNPGQYLLGLANGTSIGLTGAYFIYLTRHSANIAELKFVNFDTGEVYYNAKWNSWSSAFHSDISNLKSDIGIVEDTDTATHTIASGQYVIWKGVLKKASGNISVGATLSASNLTDVSNGIANELSSSLTNVQSSVAEKISGVGITHIKLFNLTIDLSTLSSEYVLNVADSHYGRPYAAVVNSNWYRGYCNCCLYDNSIVKIWFTNGEAVSATASAKILVFYGP